jgi:hypothetical protein
MTMSGESSDIRGLPVDGAPDGQGYCGEFIVGEVNCLHGADIIGRKWAKASEGP